MPEAFFDGFKRKLRESSEFAFEKLSDINGLTPIKAKGAIYMMIKIDLN